MFPAEGTLVSCRGNYRFLPREFQFPAEGIPVSFRRKLELAGYQCQSMYSLRSVFLLHPKCFTYLYFIHKPGEYVVQMVLFCPVTYMFWKITGIFSCRFGKPIYLCNDSVVGSGSRNAGSITYCKHFTKIILILKSAKF